MRVVSRGAKTEQIKRGAAAEERGTPDLTRKRSIQEKEKGEVKH